VTLDDIRPLTDLGLCVIPLKPGSKEPDSTLLPDHGWKKFQTQHPTADEVVAWFANGVRRNAGIPLGVVSKVVVVETDSEEAETWAEARLPHTPMRTRSLRGVHRYYRLPSGPNSRADIPPTITVADGIKIEVKRGGQYVLAPGSVHPSGHVYFAPEPWPRTLDEVPEFPIEFVLEVIRAQSWARNRSLIRCRRPSSKAAGTPRCSAKAAACVGSGLPRTRFEPPWRRSTPIAAVPR
jgi:hypothetical protein